MIYFAFLIPLFIALIYLLTALAFKADAVFYSTFWFDLPPWVLLATSFIWLYRKYVLRKKPNHEFWLYLCFLAPFALWYPWVVTNASGDPGFGGFLYFMEWLTKHPNFGPVNFQVLIGILCMILLAALPALYAFHALSDKPRLEWLMLIFSISLIAFMPVFIRLDLMLWITGFNGAPSADGAGGVLRGLEVTYGPLLHTAPLLVMSWHVSSVLFKKPANYH